MFHRSGLTAGLAGGGGTGGLAERASGASSVGARRPRSRSGGGSGISWAMRPGILEFEFLM
ncbi:hypothetical protein MFUL124B02_29880 [Myxococcus fulvus 124B02]|nr:hypothetical protein MFUL124B02_29880 [Myxococcus fulvus 124B02]